MAPSGWIVKESWFVSSVWIDLCCTALVELLPLGACCCRFAALMPSSTSSSSDSTTVMLGATAGPEMLARLLLGSTASPRAYWLDGLRDSSAPGSETADSCPAGATELPSLDTALVSSLPTCVNDMRPAGGLADCFDKLSACWIVAQAASSVDACRDAPALLPAWLTRRAAAALTPICISMASSSAVARSWEIVRMTFWCPLLGPAGVHVLYSVGPAAAVGDFAAGVPRVLGVGLGAARVLGVGLGAARCFTGARGLAPKLFPLLRHCRAVQ
jgi:hypothetical protein